MRNNICPCASPIKVSFKLMGIIQLHKTMDGLLYFIYLAIIPWKTTFLKIRGFRVKEERVWEENFVCRKSLPTSHYCYNRLVYPHCVYLYYDHATENSQSLYFIEN